MGADYLPSSDHELLRWSTNFIDYVDAGGAARFNLPADVYDLVKQLHTDFANKLKLVDEPATHTSLAVAAKNAAYKALGAAIRAMVKEYLAHNHLVTDDDRRGMGLPIYKTGHTPSPVAVTYPDYDIDSSTIRRLTIHFYDQGSKKSKAKPAGQHGAEIRWVISDTPPASLNNLTNSSFDTHTPFTLSFDENQRGKTVYFCLCWENTRGEKGPWSEIQSAIIP